MKSPITLDYRGDIEIFFELAEAEKYVEPDDVRDGNVIAYDGDGRLLRGTVVRRGLFGQGVKLEEAEQEPTHAGVLRETLIDFIARLGESPESLQQQSLQALFARLSRMKH